MTSKVLLAAGKSKVMAPPPAAALLYDPSTNHWTLTGALNQFRASHTLTRLLNGQALTAGRQFQTTKSERHLYDYLSRR